MTQQIFPRWAVLLALVLWLTVASSARADVTDVSGAGKGAVGGALVGAELFVGGEALLGVESPWAYGAGCLAGGIGGGFAGNYLERSITEQTSILLLSAGMMLVIPASVVVMSATAYRSPPQTRAPLPQLDAAGRAARRTIPVPLRQAHGQPPAPPGRGERSTTTRANLARPSTGQPTRAGGLLHRDGGDWKLAVPTVSLGEVFTRREREQWGLPRATEMHVALFTYAF